MDKECLLTKNSDRITTDALRGIATLFVFFLHGRSFLPAADQMTGCWKWILYFPAWGGYGFSCFYQGMELGKGS